VEGTKRSDFAKTERNDDVVANASVSQNGVHPQQGCLSHEVLPLDLKERSVRETVGYGVEYEGAGIPPSRAVELASVREENSNDFTRILTSGRENQASLNFKDTMIAFKGPDGDLMAYDSRRIDEELIRGDKPMSKSIPSGSGSPQIVCDRLPIRSGAEGKDEVSREMLSEGNSSGDITREGLENLVANMGGAGELKQVTTVNGSGHCTNGSSSPCSKTDSEDEPIER